MPETTLNLNGKMLGGYRIDSQLGAGGMGSVFKAHDEGLNRFVAIKVLAPELSGDRNCVDRFHHEARSIAALRHPNLMHIYSVGEESGYHFFAMEYIDGTSLGALMKKAGKMQPPEAFRFAGQIMSALHKVHCADIIHRDLKPGNVMIDSDQRAILVDFGLSKDTAADMDLTTAGTIMGTPDYMAPEQIEAEKVGPYTDIYAMGVMLYEMLSQVRPFHQKSAIMTMRAHCETRPEPLTKLCPNLPPVLAKILDKAMAREVAKRYKTIPSFAADLLRVCPTPELTTLAEEAAGQEKVKTILAKHAAAPATVRAALTPSNQVSSTAPTLTGNTLPPQKSSRRTAPSKTSDRKLLLQKIGAGCFLAFCILLVLAALRKKPDTKPVPVAIAPAQPAQPAPVKPTPTQPVAPVSEKPAPTRYRPDGFTGEIKGGELVNVRILRQDDSIEDGILISADAEKVKLKQRHTGKDLEIPLAEIKVLYRVEEWPRDKRSAQDAPHNRRPGLGRFGER
jgi:serine/threonine protein kinase